MPFLPVCPQLSFCLGLPLFHSDLSKTVPIEALVISKVPFYYKFPFFRILSTMATGHLPFTHCLPSTSQSLHPCSSLDVGPGTELSFSPCTSIPDVLPGSRALAGENAKGLYPLGNLHYLFIYLFIVAPLGLTGSFRFNYRKWAKWPNMRKF